MATRRHSAKDYYAVLGGAADAGEDEIRLPGDVCSGSTREFTARLGVVSQHCRCSGQRDDSPTTGSLSGAITA